MVKQLVGDIIRDVVWFERRDSGGMFDATVGVYKLDNGKFFAFVSQWGQGVQSPAHSSLDDAKADIERLWAKMFG